MTAHLLARFLEVGERLPDRTALGTPDRAVSYGELTERAGSAAAFLQAAARPGDRVALLSENTPEYVAALYGAWAAGLVVVGLNPALRAEEIEALVRHSGAAVTLVDPGHPEASALDARLSDVGPTTPLPEAFVSGRDDFDLTAAARGLDPSTLAQLIYTSGTTGHPKGVMLSHANLAANTASIQATLPIRPDDRALCVLPFQYSYGSSVLHTHLTLGASVLIERSLMYPAQALKRAESERASSLAGVPSTFYLLLDRTDLAGYDLSSLRYVTQAGARMDPERIERFRGALPGTQFIVMYGQTEASARLACLPPEDLARKPGSAGRAVPGVQLQVRDEQGSPVPPGEPGEVWARGANVMQGYWNDPAESAAVLVDGWLGTGDVGRLDEEGYLFLEGRARDFIKSGAYRIAPAEIEDVIRGVEGVRDVAVVGREDPLLGEAIHAHVVAESPGKDLERAIKRACVERLARYKLPKRIHFRDAFPRTASGKIRKHLLELQ